jgi:hypothetical protein
MTMTDSVDKTALEMVLRTLPTNRGFVLMVTSDGQIDSAALNMNDGEVMLACWSIAVEIASQTPEGIGIFERMLKDTLHKNEPKPRLYVAKGTVK